MLRRVSIAVGTFALAMAGSVGAVGPYAHTGTGGAGDWARWAYGPVNNAQTQRVSFQLYTQSAYDSGMHWAVGLRGQSTAAPCPWDSTAPYAGGCGLGRGLAIGVFPNASGGTCFGIGVENFTMTYPHSSGVLGVIPNTCVAYPIQDNRRYDFTVTATASNVSWNVTLYKPVQVYDPRTGETQRIWQYVSDAYGGCLESAGLPCPEVAARDLDYADVFVASAFLAAGSPWKVENLYITHY